MAQQDPHVLEQESIDHLLKSCLEQCLWPEASSILTRSTTWSVRLSACLRGRAKRRLFCKMSLQPMAVYQVFLRRFE